MAPEAMVTAVAANTTWKKKNDGVARTSPSANDSDMPDRKKVSVPMRLPPSDPKANPKPTAQKARAPTAMSARFLAMMFPMFLARVRPASTRANPACMRNTRHPATISHRLVSRAALYSAGVSSCATAGVADSRTAAKTPKRPKPTLRARLLLVRRLQAAMTIRAVLLTIAPSGGGLRFEQPDRTNDLFLVCFVSVNQRSTTPR